MLLLVQYTLFYGLLTSTSFTQVMFVLIFIIIVLWNESANHSGLHSLSHWSSVTRCYPGYRGFCWGCDITDWMPFLMSNQWYNFRDRAGSWTQDLRIHCPTLYQLSCIAFIRVRFQYVLYCWAYWWFSIFIFILFSQSL
jgi:hypothetical protein